MGTSNSSTKPNESTGNNESDKSTNPKDNSELNSSKITGTPHEYCELGAINVNIAGNDNHQQKSQEIRREKDFSIKYKLFWIDANSNNQENNIYKLYLKENYDKYNVTAFESVEPSIEKILKLSFEELFVIVSGRLYKDFINQIMNNLPKIKVVPKIIIFTGDKNKFLEYHNDLHMKNILNSSFYNLGGIQTDFINVFGFLSDDSWRIRPELSDKNPEIEETEEFTFECIDSLEALMLPRFFRTLIKINKDDNFDELNQYFYNKYLESEEIEELLSQIEGIPSIPFEILCKYYARLYTYESDFYNEINKKLRKESMSDSKHPIQKFVLSYVKLLYEGLRLNCFSSKCAKELYRFSFMSKTEKSKLEDYLNKKKEGLPAAICFSKSFLSFSENREVAEVFLKARTIENDDNEDLLKIIFILQKNDNITNESLRTYINLFDIAKIQGEREILFLPFSAFEIQSIEPKNVNGIEFYEIKLDYLDKYTDKLKSIQNNNIIKNTHFGEEIVKLGIVEKSKVVKNTNKALIENYDKFDKVFEENKQNIKNNKYSEQIKEHLNKDLIYLVKKEDIDENGEVQILGEHINGEDFLKLNKDSSYLIINGKKKIYVININ